MEHGLYTENSTVDPRGAETTRAEVAALRCDICRRRLGQTICYAEETGDVPEPRRSWVLCGECNDAVHVQMERSPVRSALRLRVAVGLVATERTPEARRGRMGMLTDDGWAKLFLWLFPITMLIHLAVIVVIAGLIK